MVCCIAARCLHVASSSTQQCALPICTWLCLPAFPDMRASFFACLAQANEAQQALEQLVEERNELVSEKDAAVRRAVDLQNSVEQLKVEVQEARATGTPHGALPPGCPLAGRGCCHIVALCNLVCSHGSRPAAHAARRCGAVLCCAMLRLAA